MGLPIHQTYSQLQTDNGKVLRITDKVVLNTVKRAKGDVLKKIEALDNPLKTSINTFGYLKLISIMSIYRRREKLSIEGCELLIYMYFLYLDTNSGVTAYGIASLYKDVHRNGSEVQSMRNKLNNLVIGGFASKVGISSSGGVLYIPSDKAINDISNIIDNRLY